MWGCMLNVKLESVNAATAADPHTGRVGGFGALFFLVALCMVEHLLAVGGIFEEDVTVRLLFTLRKWEHFKISSAD